MALDILAFAAAYQAIEISVDFGELPLVGFLLASEFLDQLSAGGRLTWLSGLAFLGHKGMAVLRGK